MKRKIALRYLIPILLLTLIATGSFGAYMTLIANEPGTRLAYAASEQKETKVYVRTESGLEKSYSIVRGSKVKLLKDEKIEEDGTYTRLFKPESEAEYYIADDNLVKSKNDVVLEKELYVRTPVTVYAKTEGPEIASYAAKGSKLSIIGYDELQDDGGVLKYKVAVEDASEASKTAKGYVYSKYLVPTQEEADAVYNEDGVYDKIKNDKYDTELYGGSAAHLDYYPTENVSFEGNEFCKDAKAMYINGTAALNPSNYVKLINSTDCNTAVIDIKDGYLTYKSKVAKEYSPSSYKSAYASINDFKKGVDAYKETGAYLIGRIVVFNDAIYAKDHPEDCIKYGGDSGWPSAYSRNVWEYNVKLALEAADLFGFNEIQFDYVRFPESSYEMSKSGKADFKNIYKEEKGQAVQNFCIYAAEMLHEAGVYMSVDVFGESAYGYMTAYGQYWPGISNVVDVISAMPYTDHMGTDGSWEEPYKTMLSWAKKAKAQQNKIKSPAAARTWITGYNTPHWNPSVDYDAKKLKEQVSALEKAGLSGGFIPWNASSDLSKYKEYKSVWNTK